MIKDAHKGDAVVLQEDVWGFNQKTKKADLLKIGTKMVIYHEPIGLNEVVVEVGGGLYEIPYRTGVN